MPSLIPSGQIEMFTGTLNNHFLTFSRDIVVFKAPQRLVTQSDTNLYLGYGNESAETNVTYIPVSGVYPAIVTFPKIQSPDKLSEAKVLLESCFARIKVRQDCRDYIRQGKTEKIIIDGDTYNPNGNGATQHYLGLKFYYFDLDKTT